MKIRLTKETLGLPEDTVLEGKPMKLTSAIMLTVEANPEASNVIMIADGFFEEIQEPTEEDRLREELAKALERIKELEDAPKPPEPQYRMLEAGEIIRAGDEDSYSGWGCVVPKAVGIPLMECNVGKFRRRVG